MRVKDKIFGANSERRSRFHSRRGVLLPAAEIARAPALLIRRLGGPGLKTQPWMARGAIAMLDLLLRPNMTLLELGSGVSTIWYAKRTKTTTSIEDHDEWADRVAVMLAGVGNVELRRTHSIKEGLVGLDGVEFDVAIVDHIDTPELSRVDAVRMLKDRAGVIVLDDSDRAAYIDADTVLSGWRRERFVSLRAKPFQATETTIYSRPSE
jgi:hypothetical protein